MSIIMTPEQLQKKITIDGHKLVMIDVRTKEGQFKCGEEVYQHSHIPKALFLDMKQDLSGKHSFMPNVEDLAVKLGELGVSNDAVIVLYDNGNNRAASKTWFIMKYIGHEAVYLLDGGFTGWVEAGYETTTVTPNREATTYRTSLRKDLVLTIDQVKERLEVDQSTLIDSRAHERYTGAVEPKYKKAGHIPGAKNFQSKHVFDEQGLWKDKKELNNHFTNLEKNEEIVVSCGSGNSACMNVVALAEAGFKDVKLYPGGFSEWIEDDANEVRQGTDS